MRILSVICFALLLLTGCGGTAGVVPVNGIVTWDETPLSDATVMFIPAEEKGINQRGMAKTGSDGKFVIVGIKGQSGLQPGQYKVTVSKMKGGTTDEPVVAAVTEADVKNDLPAIYSDPTQTVLSYSVIGDGKPIEVKLSSKRKK